MANTQSSPQPTDSMVRETLLQKSFVLLAALLVTLFVAGFALGQTTGFTYQGRLTDGGTAANGNYDVQFVLFDSAAGGNQIGTTQTLNTVTVSGGIFTVTLDFGASAFPGAGRFLEISTRLSGAGTFTTLAPRQPISSTPYAIRSANATAADTATTAVNATNATTATNATQLGGVAANQYVQTNDTRLADARTPLAGSANYIQNSTSAQAAANFNISGTGTAGGALSATTVNATTQYNIGGNRVLSIVGTNNTFAGRSAGTANTTGGDNSFFGSAAGKSNKEGSDNAFFGSQAGAVNTIGTANSFFGSSAGSSNIDGINNAFFGVSAGAFNTSGDDNSFFGVSAGLHNQGNDNSFFGRFAGSSNTVGNDNSFFGREAGSDNDHGSGNSFFGRSAGQKNTFGNDNSFFGNSAGNKNFATGNSFFGYRAGFNNAAGQFNSFFGYLAGSSNTNGDHNTVIGYQADVDSGNLNYATAIGADAIVATSNTIMLGRSNGSDKVRVPGLGTDGATALCRNANKEISLCSSSLRYKKDLHPFTRGLALLNTLKPITFKWKADNSADLGFGAEDIAAVEPLLITRNDKGEVEGVKYDRITAVLVNAVKEQQLQIQQQQAQITRQQTQVANLKQLVCRRHPRAGVCQ